MPNGELLEELWKLADLAYPPKPMYGPSGSKIVLTTDEDGSVELVRRHELGEPFTGKGYDEPLLEASNLTDLVIQLQDRINAT